MRKNSEYVNQYLKKAKSKTRSGAINHNLAIEEDYQFNMERLGGENLLRKKYPELYKVMQYTQQESVAALSNPSIQPMMARTLATNNEYVFGMDDSMKIRNINYDPNTSLDTSSSIHIREDNPTLLIIGDLSDQTNGKAVDGFAVYGNNSHELIGDISVKATSLVSSVDRTYRAASTFSFIQYDNNGNPYFGSVTDVSDAVKVLKATVVKKINIINPTPVKHATANQTVIYYNRTGPASDYAYTNVKFNTTDVNNPQVDIHVPFSGSIEFNNNFIPMPESINKDTFRLEIENLANGVAKFNKNNWDSITWKVEGNTLHFTFPDCWHTVLPTNKINNINNIDFYCEMHIPVKFMGIPYPTPIKVVIQSNGQASADPSYKKINPIKLFWGCFAKGTRIKMADNSLKAIEEINSGDEVMTVDRGAVAVKDLVVGMEEMIICIETSSGSKIEVTEDHPMMTTEGMVLARNLNAGSILVMEYGEDSLDSLYIREYNDKVFSVALETESVIIAEDFYSGDFDSQQTAMSSKLTSVQPKKLEPFQEEIAELFKAMNRDK